MNVSISCACGTSFKVSDDSDAETVPCPACGLDVLVPTIENSIGHLVETESSQWLRVECEKCKKRIKAPLKWAGRQGNCPRCKNPVLMVAPPSPQPNSDQGLKADPPQSPSNATSPPPEKDDLADVKAVLDAENDNQASGILQVITEIEEIIVGPEAPRPPEKLGYHKAPTATERIRTVVNDRRTRFRTALAIVFVLLVLTTIQVSTDWSLWGYLRSFADNFLHPLAKPKISLVEAVKSNDMAEIRANLKNGANATDTDKHGLSVLSASCVRGDLQTVKMLIIHGANPKEVDSAGVTPLHWAAGSGRADVVEYLISLGVDVNASDHEGRTPLSEAHRFGHMEVVELLTKRYAAKPATQPDLPPAPEE